jgi:large subunit ribosomal protein L15
MKLNELSDNPGAVKRRKRVGRGIGSGKGKTAGRGAKGQNSRTGVAQKGFEGGQMPLHRRLPKRGFTNIFRKEFVEVGLDRIQAAIEAGRLDASKPIDFEALKAAGIVRRMKDGVRLLGGAAPATKLSISVAGASRKAVEAVEKAGGSVSVSIPARNSEAEEGSAKKGARGKPTEAKQATSKEAKPKKAKPADTDEAGA